jgi:hypothetical protein
MSARKNFRFWRFSDFGISDKGYSTCNTSHSFPFKYTLKLDVCMLFCCSFSVQKHVVYL